jgi:hypothetical protein
MAYTEITRGAEPQIFIDKEKFLLVVWGVSYPEDAVVIFEPVFAWLETIDRISKDELKAVFYFKFLNSVSNKMVYEILYEFRKFYDEGKPVKVTWFHDENDEDIQELGEDLSLHLDIPFEILPMFEEESNDYFEGIVTTIDIKRKKKDSLDKDKIEVEKLESVLKSIEEFKEIEKEKEKEIIIEEVKRKEQELEKIKEELKRKELEVEKIKEEAKIKEKEEKEDKKVKEETDRFILDEKKEKKKKRNWFFRLFFR